MLPSRRAAVALFLVALAPHAYAQSTQDEQPVTQGVPRFTPPKLLERAEAVYPPAAAAAGTTGTVILEFVVDEKGQIGEVTVKTPAGHGFDEAAALAIKRFRFSPGLYDGTPVPAKVTYAYHFEIKVEKRPIAPPATPAEAPIRIQGQILARGTRAAVALAQITASLTTPQKDPNLPTRFEAEADADGKFALRGLPDGDYAVLITGAGIERAQFTETLKTAQALTVNYYVDRTWSSRYETVVRAAPVREEVSRQTLTTEELVKMPGSFGDPLRAIENLPGVARAPFNTGLIIVRGGKPTDSRAFLAGAEVPQLYHFGGLTSVIPAHMFEKVDYFPGNFPVRYGRAIAGAVDIDIREGRRDRLHGYLDVNAFDAGLSIEGPVGKGTFLIGARRSYVDAVLPIAAGLIGLDSAGLSFVSAPVYYDYQAVLDYPLWGGKFRALVMGSDDVLKLLFDDIAGDPTIRGSFSTHIYFHRLQLRWQRTRGAHGFYIQNAAGWQGTSGELGAGVNFGIGAFQDDTRIEWRWKPLKSFKLLVGVDSQASITFLDARVPAAPREGELPLPLSVTNILNAKETLYIWNVALYAEASIQLTKKLTFTPGLRLDRFGTVNTFTLNPRFAARYQLFPITTIKAGIGLYSQDPQPQDFQKDFGNPKLRPEHAVHYGLSVEQGIMPGMMFEVSGFYKQLYNLVASVSTSHQREGEPEPVAERVANVGDGRIYGVEFLLRQAVSKWFFGWIAYTLMKSERRDCPGCSFRLFDYDQTHIFVLALHANLPKGYEVGVRWRYITGFPYTEVLGGHFDADGDVYAAGRFPINTARLDAYHQLDVRFDKTFVFKKWQLKIYLDITNVYNRANPQQIQSAYDFTKKVTVSGLPFVPSFGVRGEF